MASHENPESGILTPRTMYEYDTHTNIPWNDVQYNPVREYLDPVKQMTERKYAKQEKGQKNNNYVTKKGFYMDYHIKVVKALPASCTYNLPDGFNQDKNKKQSPKWKIDKKLMKYTFIDRIQMEEKNRKKPGPGAYNLNKTDDQIKEQLKALSTKKHKNGQKRYFYEDTQFNSNVTPGPGFHNPHDEVAHLKMNRTDYKFWINKHRKSDDYFAKKNRSVPGPPSYSPCAISFDTFDRHAISAKKLSKKKELKSGFGTDTKFAYDRPNKKKILEVRPASCTYNTGIQWKGKNMDAKKNNWIRTRSTGFSERVYN